MLKRLLQEIYESVPVSFVAAGSPEEAADRLARGTRRLTLGSAVAGRVTVARVALRRHRAFFDNAFAPVFRGEFVVEGGRTLLRGSFQLHPPARAWLTTWLTFVGFILVSGLALGPVIAVQEGASWGYGLLTGTAFAAFVLLFARRFSPEEPPAPPRHRGGLRRSGALGRCCGVAGSDQGKTKDRLESRRTAL